jgi:transposase
MRDIPSLVSTGSEVHPVFRPGELDDACWALLDPIVPHPKPGGKQKGYTRRQFVEAYVYLLKQGCRWRELPTTCPPWHTVYERVRTWERAGVMEQIWAILCPVDPGQTI